MTHKYRLTAETNAAGLHRIEALIPGPWGPVGTRGGWVASEENLAQTGICWVYGEACVFEHAWVFENACIFGHAYVSGNAWVFDTARVSGHAQVGGRAHVMGNARVEGEAQVAGNAQVFGEAHVAGQAQIDRTADWRIVGPVGSRDAWLTGYRTRTGEIEATTGCFRGSLDDLLAAAQETHAQAPRHLRDYAQAAAFFWLHYAEETEG